MRCKGFGLDLVGRLKYSNGVGLQSMRSSNHWAWSLGLRAAGEFFLGRKGI